MNTASTVATAIAAAVVIVVVICAVSDFQVTGSFRIGKRNPPRQRNRAATQPMPGLTVPEPLDREFVERRAS